WAEVTNGDRVDLLAELTRDALADRPAADRPALVVWPETALPVLADPRRQARLYERLGSWSEQHDVALLTGAITRFDTAPALTVEPYLARQRSAASPYYNSALLFDGAAPQQIDKVHMIPFAERVPFVEWRASLAALGVASGGVGGYGRGEALRVFETGGLSFGALICFESLFGDHARLLVQRGAEFLVVLSQDGWWGQSAGYRQHFALSRLRAIEARRPLVSATVTGTSGLILPDGRVAAQTEWMDQTTETWSVPRYAGTTLYVRYGDWLNLLAFAVAAVLALVWIVATAFFPKRRAPQRRSQQNQLQPI
ncbi:MAG: apolipoprotein N-acyltransferase, partial [Rhodothermales bacterium]|nr:apolipoprotein N-acyltransferase [Rhodothermales bacterium]